MSELSRIERIAKSLIPRFPRSSNRHYKLEDARNMINEFGLDLTPDALAFLVNSDSHLDDFLMGVYHLENKLGKKVTSDFATIDEAFAPKVYEEDGTIAFTATWKGKEQVFVEYEYGERPPKTVKDIPIE